MTRHRPGFRYLAAQIPDVLWDKLNAHADEDGISVARLVTEILREKYRVPASKIPKPKRAGRKPKRPTP